MEEKWFATSAEDATEWGRKLYSDGNYRMIEIEVPTESLEQMFYVENLMALVRHTTEVLTS